MESSGNWSNEEELDLNSKKTIYYVPIRNWRVIHNDSEYHNPRHLEQLLKRVLGQDEVTTYGSRLVKPRNYPSTKTSRMYLMLFLSTLFLRSRTSLVLFMKVLLQSLIFKTEPSYKTVLNIINNRVFKRVCILLKDSGNDELVKELFKIRRIISINRDASKSISEEDNGFANDFENFAGILVDSMMIVLLHTLLVRYHTNSRTSIRCFQRVSMIRLWKCFEGSGICMQ